MGCNGLTTINVELTSRCNKGCWMCGRRKRDKIYHDLKYGDMEWGLVEKIANDVTEGLVIQVHNNGEPLLYPRFGDAVELFKKKRCLVNTVTNGKLLLEKFDEIVNNLDTLSISIFENDEEADEQYKIIKEFLHRKGSRRPYVNLRLIGKVDRTRYEALDQLIITRLLHAPEGSFNYKRGKPTIPEIGVCLDLMHHLAIDRHGNVSVCVRFDPEGDLIIGDMNHGNLYNMWYSQKRIMMKELHIAGRRDMVPFCSKCHFWGVPTGE